MNASQLLNRVILVATLVFIGFAAWFFSDIVAYLLISVVIWFMLTPLVNFLDYTGYKGRSLPRWLATLLAIIIFIGVFVALGFVFVPMAIEQGKVLANINQDKLLEELVAPFGQLESWLAENNINLKSEIEGQIQEINVFGTIGDFLENLISLAGELIVGMFAVFFISFFFLKDESLVRRIILGATPDEYLEKTGHVLSNAKRLLSRYFLGLLTQVTLIATLVTVGMTVLGVENAFLIGFFAGIINVIPYLGPVIGSTFGMFMVFTTQIEVGIDAEAISLLLWALGVFTVVQLLDNIVFQPLIFSNSVNAHPLEIFLIIFIAGKIGGVVGMVSAIPAYTLIRIIAKEFLIQFKVVQNLTKNI